MVGTSDARSPLTDTSTLTADLETMEEEDIIRPQPSQAFEALDGIYTHTLYNIGKGTANDGLIGIGRVHYYSILQR